VGAGGGSIARIDASGLLRVGPESAGAQPGPICYGRGGTRPTISDANLLLGRLNPAKLTAVEAAPPLKTIRAVFARELGAPLGLGAEEAAFAVIRIANTSMAGAIRMVSVSLGADPRDFALFAFGGAGPLHASALARELGIPRVLVPARPGLTNALGCAVADLRHDFVNTLNRPLDALDMGELHRLFQAQREEGQRLIGQETVELREIRYVHSVDMQFIGQTHLLRVALPTPTPGREELARRFEEAYFARFRVELAEIRPALVNVNTSVVGLRPETDLAVLIDPAGRLASVEAARTDMRRVFFEAGWRDTPIYWRDHLPLEAAIAGPAIIEQMDTTIVVEPGDMAQGDVDGNLVITIGGGA
ncbi:MAG TPA: hydantoinase/oxoprolinase family protein, partial [Paracoccaceae bacterium]|nr:hydantoinase/oxoprolinase family protein [Paracoccaceae bacterium]